MLTTKSRSDEVKPMVKTKTATDTRLVAVQAISLSQPFAIASYTKYVGIVAITDTIIIGKMTSRQYSRNDNPI